MSEKEAIQRGIISPPQRIKPVQAGPLPPLLSSSDMLRYAVVFLFGWIAGFGMATLFIK